jgi:hypothetical protein
MTIQPTKVRNGTAPKTVFWHHELPPFDAEPIGEHIVEAASRRVPGTLAHRDELWAQCYGDLMSKFRVRLSEEMIRLGGDYAHVLSESVDSKHDPVTVEAWLQGRVTYMLYRTKSNHPDQCHMK